ncbi:Beta-lactamase [compost metagenome]
MKTSLNFLAVLLLISTFSFGQDITKKIDSIIKDSYQKNPDIGISVGFIKNSEEYYTAYGKLNAESQMEINRNSLFEIASITKILTSNLIAQAVIDHKIKTDD